MEQSRADVELTIQIGAEEDETVLAILMREARARAKRMLGRPQRAAMIEEEQWCSSAMRVTVRRPLLPPVATADPAAMPPPKDPGGAAVAKLKLSIFDEILAEREEQDRKWGGSEHDDMHVEADWLDYVHGKVMAIPERFRSRGALRGIYPDPSLPARSTPAMIAAARLVYRRRLVQIAALAVAAVESFDREGK